MAAGPNHVSFKLSALGESIGLYRSADDAIDTVTFGPQLEGVSEGRLPDGGSAILRFPETPTPNNANYLPLSDVVINEVLSHTDPPLEDAIELYNGSTVDVDVGGWYLSDSAHDLLKYRIPDDTVISAGGYRVFYETNFFLDPNLSSPFALDSAHGDQVYLCQASTNGALTGYRATVSFGAAESGVSFGRCTNGVGQVDFVALNRLTFGVDDPETVEVFRMGPGRPNAAPKVGPLVITEIMFHPPDVGGLDNVTNEFIEIHNPTAQMVPLYDVQHPTNVWRLDEGIRFDFPPNTAIPAGDYLLVVSFDPANELDALASFRAAYQLSTNMPMVGPYSGKLDNGGESVELYKPDVPEPAGDPDAGFVPNILVERITYDDVLPWPTNPSPDGGGASLQRVDEAAYGNDPLNWLTASPTPGPQGLQVDFDNDGMPDVWETDHGLDATRNDAALDYDGDGLSNLEEYYAGTLPDDAQSRLGLTIAVTDQVVLTFTANPDRAYVIEFKDELAGETWLPLATISAQATTRTEQATDTPPTTSRYYRLHMTQWP